ncbi:MaoC family dehydratase [Sphaerimonospora sp. CA-214678]|uniref:MaoC family dehydratase n=1 Tax=Sphaerimonospora sp. CA-214678 TaxID=3240029 RepID=UPI003D900EFD
MNPAEPHRVPVDGPYFEDLHIGRRFDGAPAVTLTEGLATAHQAIVGCRLPLVLDHGLSHRVIGDPGGPRGLAAPNLVWDVAIGQSTLATHTVVANLFYRGVVFHRAPLLGDTLSTITEVVGLRQNSRRPGRAPTGLAELRISTVDQRGRPVLGFRRCAMLPLRDAEVDTGHADDLSGPGTSPSREELRMVASRWDLSVYRARRPGPHFADLTEGTVFDVAGGDVVSSAPELARLTLNVAKVHHDASASGAERLVYGGHTIGIALHQAVRALPDIVTVVGWHGCDHLGPVHEGDTLTSTIEVERLEPLAEGGLAHLRSRVRAGRPGHAPADVLDWRYIAVLA